MCRVIYLLLVDGKFLHIYIANIKSQIATVYIKELKYYFA